MEAGKFAEGHSVDCSGASLTRPQRTRLTSVSEISVVRRELNVRSWRFGDTSEGRHPARRSLSHQVSANQEGVLGRQPRPRPADLARGPKDSASLSRDHSDSFFSCWRGMRVLPAKCRKQFAGREHSCLVAPPNPWRQQTAKPLSTLSTSRVILTWHRALEDHEDRR